MAILDKSKKPYIVDRDENVFIGIDLPFRKSDGVEGLFASTSTTIEAAKVNLKCLLNTKKGERIFQPSLGLDLQKYLFEQITTDTELEIQNDISQTVRAWLPFITIQNISVYIDENQQGHTINVSVTFNINRDPTSLDTVSVTIGGD